MSIGKRRLRPSRAQLRPSAATISLKQDRQARQRTQAARLTLVIASLLATTAIVHGSGPPFNYRLGERADREIRVNVDEFRIRNQTKTSNERQAAADQVPPVMVNDPAQILDLADRLDDLTVAIAKADRFEDVHDAVRSNWKLRPEVFAAIKSAVAAPADRDKVHAQIAAAVRPLARDGILGAGTLPPNEESSRTLSVRQKGEPRARARLVARERVIPERMAKPDGPVFQEFCGAFSPHQVGQVLFGLISEKFDSVPTLSFEAEATAKAREAARARVPDHYDTFTRGEVLVEQGQTIGEEQLILLRLEHDRAVNGLRLGDRVRRGLGILALVGALFLLTGYYAWRHESRLVHDLRKTALICGLVIVAPAAVRLLNMHTWDAELVPVAIASMIVAIAFNPHFALVVTFTISLLTCVALGTDLAHFLVLMGGTAAGALTLNEVRTRTKLIKVGATAAVTYFLMTWATGLWLDQPIDLVRSDGFWRAGWGLMAGFFLGGSLPFLEGVLGIVTGISLLELGDNTHPLLQELVRRAPGTHNHSITVGAIAESAAERIGADALLVRIGAYFHDIGKMLKPHYFVENQVGTANRHAKLAPAMSTLIIIGHVKDGVDLGRQHHLPEPILDLIEQHHGTTLVEYFYYEANRRNGNNPDASAVPESAFRYPGPKPQTREAAILMVADAVESASRTLSEPTPSRIEGLVTELIDKRLRDGQFDECGLTLREIAEIRECLIKSLIGIYHGRVKYPEHRTA
jgi:putative nucleotidyltransferase with HDIG domain